MRTLVLAVLVVASSLAVPAPARAESLGVGIFVGEPLGLDLKIGLQGRSALDIVIGATTLEDGRQSYGHLQYLYTFAIARGRSVRLPFRFGFGGYVAGVTEEDAVALGARVPFQLGVRFRRTPIEIYGEVAFVLQLLREGPAEDVDPDVDGGVGLRVYF